MVLAEKLALALGNISEMSSYYHDDVVWTVSESLAGTIGRPEGKPAVIEVNKFANTVYDAATVKVEILDALEQGNLSVVRIIYRANMLPSNEAFEGENTFFVKEQDGKIIEINERLDTLKIALARGIVAFTGKTI